MTLEGGCRDFFLVAAIGAGQDCGAIWPDKGFGNRKPLPGGSARSNARPGTISAAVHISDRRTG